MWTAGIDPSSKKLAIVTADLQTGEPIEAYALTLRKSTESYTPASAERAYQCALDSLNGIAEVWMEAPVIAGARDIQATIKQSFVSGAVQAAAVRLGCRVYLVPTATWKKRVIGKGNATKDEVKGWVSKEWPRVWPRVEGDQDLIDAAALCRYGLGAERRRVAS